LKRKKRLIDEQKRAETATPGGAPARTTPKKRTDPWETKFPEKSIYQKRRKDEQYIAEPLKKKW